MNGKCSKCSKWPSGEPPFQPRKWSDKGNNVLSTHNCYSYMLNDLFSTPRKYHKPQPGIHFKLRTRSNTYHGIQTINCTETIKGVMKDNPHHVNALSLSKGRHYTPPPKHYKGIMMVSPDNDYHFARQDNRLLKVYTMLLKDGVDLKSDSILLRDLVDYSRLYMPEIYMHLTNAHKTSKQKARFLYKNSKTWSHKPGSTAVSDKDADGNIIFDPLLANWNFKFVNYSRMCCFFIIPMNTHKKTCSTGTPSFIQLGHPPVPASKIRKNISATVRQQNLDKRVRKLLHV